jgi:hypothetical protein
VERFAPKALVLEDLVLRFELLHFGLGKVFRELVSQYRLRKPQEG